MLKVRLQQVHRKYLLQLEEENEWYVGLVVTPERARALAEVFKSTALLLEQQAKFVPPVQVKLLGEVKEETANGANG